MTISAYTTAFAESVRLLLDLHALYVNGDEDSSEADAIRDAMDDPWYAMTEDEQTRVRQLSADLYTIGERHRGPKPGAEIIASLEQATTKKDWMALLALLQEYAGLAEPAVRNRLRGTAWAGLGVPAAAVLFLEDALSTTLLGLPATPATQQGSANESGAANDKGLPTVYVVGFSGSVSEGAAGIKEPVFELGGRYFFAGYPESPPGLHHGREEIEEYRERGLLSLLSKPQVRKPDHVFLYAHPAFLLPSIDSCNLHLEPGTLHLDDALGAYYQYMAREEAVAWLQKWAEILLADAERSLRASAFRRAKESAMRARFGAARELPEHQTNAHSHVAARMGLGKDTQGVLRNVVFGFSQDVADRVNRRARGILSRAEWWEEAQKVGDGRQRGEDRYVFQFAAAA